MRRIKRPTEGSHTGADDVTMRALTAPRSALRSHRSRLHGGALLALVTVGGALAAATPASAAESCPWEATAPVVHWETVEQGNAVTLCRGVDEKGDGCWTCRSPTSRPAPRCA